MTDALKPTSSTTIAAMLGLTFATGIIDAASVLGPGHAFTANMTGNVVFLGFALVGAGGTSIVIGSVALGAFLAGAALGGRAVSGVVHKGARGAFAIEIVMLAGAVIAARLLDSPLAMIALLAAAMGLRNAVVRRLAVPDMTTTVLTLTLTGLAADSSLSGGTNPRWGRRVAAAVSMLIGAAAGAALLGFGLSAAIGAALAVEIVAAGSLLHALAREHGVTA